MATVHTLLRSSYPMAHIQLRSDLPGGAGPSMWDVFRDEDSFDRELVRRARHGDAESAGHLYDRHGSLALAVAIDAVRDPEAAATAVIAGHRTVIERPSAADPVRIQIALSTRSAAMSSVAPRERGPERPRGSTTLQRSVIELALTHRLLGSEIALVLGLDIRDVRRLANDGLTAAARTLPKTAPSEDP